jgi:hypothetical protein
MTVYDVHGRRHFRKVCVDEKCERLMVVDKDGEGGRGEVVVQVELKDVRDVVPDGTRMSIVLKDGRVLRIGSDSEARWHVYYHGLAFLADEREWRRSMEEALAGDRSVNGMMSPPVRILGTRGQGSIASSPPVFMRSTGSEKSEDGEESEGEREASNFWVSDGGGSMDGSLGSPGSSTAVVDRSTSPSSRPHSSLSSHGQHGAKQSSPSVVAQSPRGGGRSAQATILHLQNEVAQLREKVRLRDEVITEMRKVIVALSSIEE